MVEIKITPLSGETHQAYTMGAGVLTLSLPLHAEFLLMQAITQNVRYTLDGTAPTAGGLGFQLKAGDPPVMVHLKAGVVMKFLREASGAILQYQYG